MFDWLRNLSKSQEEKRRERLNAYLDDGLSPGEREVFEQELADNVTLRTELAELRGLKAAVRQLPRLTVPRNFTLNPAMAGQPLRSSGPNFYPALRLATVLTAFLLVAVLALDAFRLGGVGQSAASEVTTFSGAAEMDEASDDTAFEAYDAAADSDDGSERALTLEAPQAVTGETAANEAEEPSPAEEANTATVVITSAAATPSAAATSDENAPAGAQSPPAETTPTPTSTATATATLLPTPAPPAPLVTPDTVPVDDIADGPSSGLTILRLIQIGLGILFLVLLGITLRQRRKMR